jgi:hypothetical protein
MPQLPHSIELHDSDLSGIEQKGGAIHLFFSPAYIHRDGKGWAQEVEIIVHEATIEGKTVAYPVTLDGGFLKTQLGLYHNLLNIPFSVSGPVEFKLELISGEVVTIKGNGVAHEFKGEPVFIEEVASRWP